MHIKDKFKQEYFLLIIKEHSAAFYRYAYSILLNRQDAEDAVSETILKAFEHLNDLIHIHKMKSWIFQILANTCKTLLSKRLYVSDDIDNHVPEPADQEAYMDLQNCFGNSRMNFWQTSEFRKKEQAAFLPGFLFLFIL